MRNDGPLARTRSARIIAACAFYSRVLAVKPTLDVPGMTELPLGAGESAILGLMPESGVTRLLGPHVDPSMLNSPGRAELYLLVDDPAAYHRRAVAAGGRELSPLATRDWAHLAAYSVDLDGYVVAFARRLE